MEFVPIKLCYGEDHEGIRLAKNNLSVEGISKKIRCFWNVPEMELKYKDNEGDVITIESDKEFEDAVEFIKPGSVLQIFVSGECFPNPDSTKSFQERKVANTAVPKKKGVLLSNLFQNAKLKANESSKEERKAEEGKEHAATISSAFKVIIDHLNTALQTGETPDLDSIIRPLFPIVPSAIETMYTQGTEVAGVSKILVRAWKEDEVIRSSVEQMIKMPEFLSALKDGWCLKMSGMSSRNVLEELWSEGYISKIMAKLLSSNLSLVIVLPRYINEIAAACGCETNMVQMILGLFMSAPTSNHTTASDDSSTLEVIGNTLGTIWKGVLNGVNEVTAITMDEDLD